MGRPRLYASNELIDAAIDVFWTKGYDATTTKDLLQALQIGQGSFYNTFKGGKRELFEKCLLHFSDNVLQKFKTELQQSADEITFLKDFFRNTVNTSLAHKLKGCLLSNTVVELTNVDSELKDFAKVLLVKMEGVFVAIIKQAQQNGRLRNTTSPEILAKHLINLWNGIHVTQKLNPDSTTMSAVVELNLEPLY